MKLTKNNVDIVDNIVNFICALVFKDEITALKNETQVSASNAARYISAYLKTDNLTQEQRNLVVENYVEQNPYYKDLETVHGIKPYISRLVKDLDIIYQSDKLINANSYLYNYNSIYKECLRSFYATSYSVAMESKENYREFCLLSINLMAFLQLLNKWLENPYDINLMAESQVDKFMNSFGIGFFNNMPYKYKQIIARNLNKLITFKGTETVIIDILELFGFNKININKYYLVKQAVANSETFKGQFDARLTNNYDIYFLSHNVKLPSLNYAIQKNLYSKFTYEQITNLDEYWKISRNELLQLNFNCIEVKYFSIETAFNIDEEIINTAFILNLLKTIRTSYPNQEVIEVYSNFISDTNPVFLEDIIIALQILLCDYYGVSDTIDYDIDPTLKTNEFSKYDTVNTNTNIIRDVNRVIIEDDIELSDLRNYSEFSTNALLEIYNNNTKVKEYFEKLMAEETDYHQYKRIRQAYESKFYQNINFDIYESQPTLMDYLKVKNIDLYTLINNLRMIYHPDDKKKNTEDAISTLTDIVTDVLADFSIFLNATAMDILLSYIRKVILVFKSFTTELLDLNVFVAMKEQHQTKLLDELGDINTIISIRESLEFEESYSFGTKFEVSSNIYLNDKINITTVTYP